MKKIQFMKYKFVLFAISAVIFLIGGIFGVIHGGFNLGMDFTGGAQIWADLGKEYSIQDVKLIIDKFDDAATITTAGDTKHEVLIKTKHIFSNEERAQLQNAFNDKFGIDASKMQFDTIGAVVGAELRNQALIALALAMLGIMIYVSFRFEWKFGLAGVLALVHDLLMMFTVYLVLDIPVNSSFIAAVLTIVGYSINDTIVIFDRMRENMKLQRKWEPESLADDSINSTLARSINTVMTVLICVGALYVLGVPAIKEFALPLFIGIASGCYSSIFIASPIWVLLKGTPKKKRLAA